MSTDANVLEHKELPQELRVLPLRNVIVFPHAVTQLAVGIPRSVKLIEDALAEKSVIGVALAKDASIEEPAGEEVNAVGTVVRILRVARSNDGAMQVVVQGLERFRIEAWLPAEPYLRARVEVLKTPPEKDLEIQALERTLRGMAKEIIELMNLPNEARNFVDMIDDPDQLVFLTAANAQMETEDGQKLLEAETLRDRLRSIIAHLSHEKEVLNLGKKIQTEAREEMDKAQREYFLRQQLKAIQKELGELDENQETVAEYTEKLEQIGMPEEAKKEASRELKRLAGMPPQSAEYPMIKTYMDWMVELPWSRRSEDQLDIQHARAVLDEDHYDLEEVKDRIIEYLAVRKLLHDREAERKSVGAVPEQGASERDSEERARGVILLFVGPPGVGKTSLGQSIARALGRSFTRMSLGGMRDEAEIRGHRRTYIGAMPGRIMQSIKRAGTRNPVFMLDEIDKVGSDWRGDPSSALLEVLDPAQNHAFRDHYLNVDFDLSDVIFITTANQLETIPGPLRDRMEIIQLDGYTELEKQRIAELHLVPRQLRANGLKVGEVRFTEEALQKIVQDYTRESGVRSLERRIGAVCRKCAVKISAGETASIEVTADMVRELLKKEAYQPEAAEAETIPGIATGLAVTPVGGDILFIEATMMKGKGEFTLTGQLGEVMRESARIAYSYVRSKASDLGIDGGRFAENDVHIHVPAGAVPKDGPSAGVAMVMAVASLFAGRPIAPRTGMTGEVTLRGRVLPVGGIKMKLLAAHRAGLNTVLLPRRNERDLDELPPEVRDAMRFVLVDRIDEALDAALAREGGGALDNGPAFAVNGVTASKSA